MANPNPKTDHLNKFPKGVSGNPKGRPKGESTVTILKRLLERTLKAKDPITGENSQITIKEALLLKQLAQAMKGNEKSFDRIFDRLEGKPVQKTENKNENINKEIIIDIEDDED